MAKRSILDVNLDDLVEEETEEESSISSEDYVFEMPLENIMITRPIARAVQKYANYDWNPRRFQLENGAPAPLNRMGRVLEDGEQRPIIIEPKGDFYSIIDGRHRFAKAIILNQETIPVIVHGFGS